MSNCNTRNSHPVMDLKRKIIRVRSGCGERSARSKASQHQKRVSKKVKTTSCDNRNEKYEENNNHGNYVEECNNSDNNSHSFEEQNDVNNFSDSDIDLTNNNVKEDGYWFYDEDEKKDEDTILITPICEGFDINIKIDNDIEDVLKHKLPADDTKPIIIDSNISKGEFSRELIYILQKHKCFNGVEKDILVLFAKCFPEWEDHNLPLSKKIVERENFENGLLEEKILYKSQAHEYISPNQTTYCFDICKNGCSVFEGKYQDYLQCFICNSIRFNPCTIYPCNLNFHEKSCAHSLRSRKAFSSVHYKPILPLIIHLIKTKGFIDALYFKNNDTQQDGVLTDVMDGQIMKIHMHEMDQNARSFANANKDKTFTHVPILFSLFYDGVKLYSSKVATFWPLVLSILNLPPTFRTSVGAGMFMVALFTAIKNTDCEEFIFSDCLAPELKRLYKGVFMEIDNNNYFIQARLIIHVLDTPAVAEHLKVQGHMAAKLCALCNSIYGVFREGLGVKWEGHRGMLEETNYLKFFGQSGTCCPEDYYKSKDAFSPVIVDSNQSECKILPIQATSNMLKHLSLCCDNNNDVREKILTAVRTETYTWHHSEIGDPKKLKDNLFYHHFDLRQRHEYSRRTNTEYINNAKTAKENGLECNGVKGLWAHHSLGYADVEHHVMWEYFHIFLNISKNTISNLKDERINWNVVSICKLTLCHPCLYPTKLLKEASNYNNKDSTIETSVETSKTSKEVLKLPKEELELPVPIWAVPPKKQREMDSWINALIVPQGYKQHFQVKYVFQRTGNLRGASHLQFLSVLLNFVMSAAVNVLHESFLLYYAMLSSDVTALMQHSVRNDQIENMFYRTAETLGTHEGILPISECNLIYHQMLDGVNHILKAGPIRGWWALAGERAMGVIKRFITKGGISFEKTVIERYGKYESNMILSAYNFDINNCHKGMPKLPSDLLRDDMFSAKKLTDGNSVLVFSDQNILLKKIISLPNTLKNKYQTHTDEKESLFTVFTSYIEKRTVSLEDALIKSPFYRIHYFYEKHFQNKEIFINNMSECLTFSSWIDYWSLCITTNTLPSKFIICDQYPNPGDFSRSLEKGIFNSLDISIIFSLKSSSHLITAFFTEAIIFGNKFHSRGFGCNESKNGRTELRYGSDISNTRHWPTKDENNLRNNWFKKKSRSAWCKFRYKSNNNRSHQKFGCKSYDNDNIYCYGQINFFMQIFIRFDTFLSGISLASITCRHHMKHDRVDYILGDDGDSFNPKIIFVPLIDIFPTPILLGAFHSPSMNNLQITSVSKQSFDAQTQRGRNIKVTNYKDVSANIRITIQKPQVETLENECLNKLKNMLKDSLVFHINKADRIQDIHYANETSNINDLQEKLSYLVLLDMMPHRNSIKYSLDRDSLFVNVCKNLDINKIVSYIIL